MIESIFKTQRVLPVLEDVLFRYYQQTFIYKQLQNEISKRKYREFLPHLKKKTFAKIFKRFLYIIYKKKCLIILSNIILISGKIKDDI